MNLFGKILDGNTVLAAVLIKYPHSRCLVTTRCLSISFGDVLGLQQSLLPAFLPGSARRRLISGIELFVEPTAVEVTLELSDVPLFAVVAAHLVKDLNENSQKRVDLGFADDVRFLVNVEQNAFRRDADRSFEITAQNFVVATLREKQVKSCGAVDLPVFQK